MIDFNEYWILNATSPNTLSLRSLKTYILEKLFATATGWFNLDFYAYTDATKGAIV